MLEFKESIPFDYCGYFAVVVPFLEKYSWIFRYNNTKFIRFGVLEQLPREWIDDLDTLSNEEFNQIPLGLYKDSWSSSFREFLSTVRSLQVGYEEYAVPEKETRICSKVKKHYEVASLGSYIVSLQNVSKEPPKVYVDFGCGVGLLAGFVHNLLDVKVLGIDGNPALIERCNESTRGKNDLQFVHHFITINSFEFIKRELMDRFSESDTFVQATVMGLHACADLSVTAIKCFLQSSWCRSITIMPCCYHLMKTIQEETPANDGIEFQNFPLSAELRRMVDDGNRGELRRCFLRLACQQTSSRWKNLTTEQHLQHGRTMFRRSLIDAILEVDELVHVGKRKQLPEETTVDNMLQQFTLRKASDQQELPWTEQHRGKLSALLGRYGTVGPRLAEYVECLQMCLQKICENVVLLDRMCYLEKESKRYELNISRKLVRLQNDGLTPRCFIFHASKDE